MEKRNVVITAVILLAAILLCWGTVALGANLADQLLDQEGPTPTAAVDPYPGVLILAVFPDSPGARSGLQPGQIILEADGVVINTPADLQALLATKESGDAINLHLLVAGEQRQTEVFRGFEPPYLGVEIIENGPDAAIYLETPTARAAEELEETAVPPTIDAAQLGLAVIAEVLPDTPAAEAGLEVGDVITAVDGSAILTNTELAQILGEKAAGDTITLTFRRGPDTLTRSITLAPHPDNSNRGFLGVELQSTP